VNWNDPIRSPKQADSFLESLVRPDPRPYNQRVPQQAVSRLLARLGNPQRKLQVIHIGGSKGKGSTALMLEAILQQAGRRTGVFTSPHLQRWSERYRLDGREVDGERFAATMEQLRLPVRDLHREDPDQAPAFFDVATAAALLLFQQAGVDYAILEAGIGGRLDATTIVYPKISCITSIELEHTDKLGNSIAAIAWEKAGIIKPGVPLLTGRLSAAAAREITARAEKLGSPLLRLGEALEAYSHSMGHSRMGLTICIHDHRLKTSLPLPMAPHLADNAALAATCAQGLLAPNEWDEAVCRGLSQVHLPGRCEILCRQPWVLVDAAHTQVSAQALAATLNTLPTRPIHLLLSLSVSKDPWAICAPLLPLAESVTVTQADPLRSLPADALAAIIRRQQPGTPIHILPDPIPAVQHAYDVLPVHGLLCITGSVYMAGLGRTVLTSAG